MLKGYFISHLCLQVTRQKTRMAEHSYMIGRWWEDFTFVPTNVKIFHYLWYIGRNLDSSSWHDQWGEILAWVIFPRLHFSFEFWPQHCVECISCVQKLCPSGRREGACSRRLSWVWTTWPFGSEHCRGDRARENQREPERTRESQRDLQRARESQRENLRES